MKLRLQKLEDLDKLKLEGIKERNKPILIDEHNQIRRRELQRTLDFIMKMDLPVLDLVAKICSIGSVPLLLILLVKIIGG